MGKRSNKHEFKRRANDFYPTPLEAVYPLLPFLPVPTRFIEPCVGGFDLVHHLESAGHQCVYRSDLPIDARVCSYPVIGDVCFITNPPWTRQILHPIIDNLRRQAPTWLLLDADWMHTKQARPYLKHCSDIVTVGRVKWIPDSPYTGKDNACWYRFINDETPTRFHADVVAH